ncbi:unnamed protein product [Ascophyllum nodosum]
MVRPVQRVAHLGYCSIRRYIKPKVSFRTFSSSNGADESDGGGHQDEELHPTWRGLERRLITRLPRERGPGVPEGRSKPKPSEEEFWHAAGVYDSTSGRQNTQNTSSTNNNVAPGEAACARLSTVKVSAENLPRIINVYKKSVAPVLQVKGFCGAQVFSDQAAGTVQSLTMWESWGDLENAVADPRYAKAMRSVQDLIEAPPVVIDTQVACSILPTTGGGDCGDVS